MRTLIVVSVLLVGASAGSFADESGFDGSWVWDREATSVLLSQGNSDAKEKLDEALAKQPDRQWNVDSGIIEAYGDGKLLDRQVYTIRPIEDGKFELLIDVDGTQTYVVIRRTETGFCFVYGGDYSQPPPDSKSPADCFKRARQTVSHGSELTIRTICI